MCDKAMHCNGGTLTGLTWQQDGAPPHASDQNIRYLARQFNGRLIARRSEPFGGRDWAARSPDLNPLDYGTGWLFSDIEVFGCSASLNVHSVPNSSDGPMFVKRRAKRLAKFKFFVIYCTNVIELFARQLNNALNVH